MLKTLHRPRDIERRGRLYRETAALRTLDSSGVPRLLDTNAEQFSDCGVSLFVVMEYVPGLTIADAVPKGGVDADTAAQVALALLQTLAYCHERDVTHRDLKPNNVVLRDNDFGRPVLVDFGLAGPVGVDASLGPITYTDQQLGNRFLGLPELLTPTGSKRDRRSDITQCVGLYFFLLTGLQPMTLADEMGRRPHQRDAARAALRGAGVRDAVLRVFDQGFQEQIDQRFQSAEALADAIRLAQRESGSDGTSVSAALRALTDHLGTPDSTRRTDLLRRLRFALDEMSGGVSDAAHAIGSATSWYQSDFGIEVERIAGRSQLGLVSQIDDGHRFVAYCRIYVNGSELVATVGDGGESVTVMRQPLASASPSVDIRERVRNYYILGFARALQERK